ncbi:MAG: protein translocase subunit SecD [Gammaproteobacteria bacterium]|nr:MAG: protein translocase subunit SecD [Gammaproteobacteria bacterium]
MINKYPLWKNLLIIVAIVCGVIYAIPNFYDADYAIQIGKEKLSEKLSEQDYKKINAVLDGLAIKPYKTDIEGETPATEKTAKSYDHLLLRYKKSKEQLEVHKTLSTQLKDYSVTMNLANTTPKWLEGINAEPMYLGLDLRGGIHFLLEIDMKTARRKNLTEKRSGIRTMFRENKVYARRVTVKEKEEYIDILFKDQESLDKGKKVLENDETFKQMIFSQPEGTEGYRLQLRISQKYAEKLLNNAMDKNLIRLRDRVNQLGVAEPIVQKQGKSRIVVELPGVQDSKKARTILGSTATLEFRMVDEDNNLRAADVARSGRVPYGSKLFYEDNGRPVLLKDEIMLTGEYIEGAFIGPNEQSSFFDVHIDLNSAGGSRFFDITKNEIGNKMAVVYIENNPKKTEVDGKEVWTTEKKEEVISIATIQASLSKRFRITGRFSAPEASELATFLKAGALAAPVKFVEERTVGPSMGEKNIAKGKEAIAIGMLLVVLFMIIYYKMFGLIANIALVANVALMLALLSLLQATLTLPGIAGIVLTVGMAVDANVLIFERIREEIKNGLTPQAAINSGYDKAFWTIFDANLTTFIAAIILYMAGTGPIKGFAVTLSIGIATSMFTAIMVSRMIANFIYGGRKIEKLSI